MGWETIITNCPMAMVAKMQLFAIEADVAKLRKRAHREEREGKRLNMHVIIVPGRIQDRNVCGLGGFRCRCVARA